MAQQQLFATVLTRDVVRIIRQMFDPADLGRSWSATKLALDALIRERRRRSAGLAARYYVDVRRLAAGRPGQLITAPSGRSVRIDPGTGLLRTAPARATPPAPRPATPANRRAALLEPGGGGELGSLSEDEAWAELDRIAPARPGELDDDRVDVNLNATGIATYQRAIRSGRTEAQAMDTMGVNLSGSATTLALEGGREVVHEAVQEDEEAIGWARVGKEDPCAFCAMLISRGAVYRSEATAGGRKNKNFVGDEMFKFHDHDRCVAVPVFDPTDPILDRAEALYDQWLQATSGHSNQAARNVWRDYWEKRPRGADDGGAPEG